MEFLQSTLEEIIESERRMLVTAEQRYGRYYTHACKCTVFLSSGISGVNHDRMMFGRFFAQMKKHHTLSLFSALRLHKVQAMMNLRQVLEAGASAAFAIANPEQHHFADVDEKGILDPSQPLAKKRYKWLRENYEAKSRWIKERKDQINTFEAHANIVSANSVFKITEANDEIKAPFFDFEDEYVVKVDLLRIAALVPTLMDFFYGVNQNRDVISFEEGFEFIVQNLATENEALSAEIRATDRYKQSMKKYGPPEAQ